VMSLKGATCITPCVQGNLGCAAAPSPCIAFQVAQHRRRRLNRRFTPTWFAVTLLAVTRFALTYFGSTRLVSEGSAGLALKYAES